MPSLHSKWVADSARPRNLLIHREFEEFPFENISFPFQELLTKHKMLCAEFLENNYDKVFQNYQKLLNSENYVTKRQSLKVSSQTVSSIKASAASRLCTNNSVWIQFFQAPRRMVSMGRLTTMNQLNIEELCFVIDFTQIWGCHGCQKNQRWLPNWCKHVFFAFFSVYVKYFLFFGKEMVILHWKLTTLGRSRLNSRHSVA